MRLRRDAPVVSWFSRTRPRAARTQRARSTARPRRPMLIRFLQARGRGRRRCRRWRRRPGLRRRRGRTRAACPARSARPVLRDLRLPFGQQPQHAAQEDRHHRRDRQVDADGEGQDWQSQRQRDQRDPDADRDQRPRQRLIEHAFDDQLHQRRLRRRAAPRAEAVRAIEQDHGQTDETADDSMPTIWPIWMRSGVAPRR